MIETVENRWDILYKDYPEVYNEFAKVHRAPRWDEVVSKSFDLSGKAVADIGSGSGVSTFLLARYAKNVIGIEPEDSMRRLAEAEARRFRIKNVSFEKGYAEKIPLGDGSVDVVIGVTVASFYKKSNIERFVEEAGRVAAKGGLVISVDIAPGWYGGELAPVILGRSRRGNPDSEILRNETFTELGFKHKDFYQQSEFESLEKILSTYGFIFGKKAIDYLKEHNKTSIKWKFRIYYKKN
jgi:ubiquinone/menaquinone biosynthesis C-methylase UbiE